MEARRIMRRGALARPGCPGQEGFTLIEVMIALTILLLGIGGLLAMHLTAMRATSFSRHATEATVLAEGKMEALRTEPATAVVGGTDQVDARGVLDPDGLYTRTWTAIVVGDDTEVGVEVAWSEQGGEIFRISLAAVRN
jgi:type IV pilus assembly protein PilV